MNGKKPKDNQADIHVLNPSTGQFDRLDILPSEAQKLNALKPKIKSPKKKVKRK